MYQVKSQVEISWSKSQITSLSFLFSKTLHLTTPTILILFMITKTLKLRNKPWINNQIQQMMRIREKLFQQFKQTEFTPFINSFVIELLMS